MKHLQSLGISALLSAVMAFPVSAQRPDMRGMHGSVAGTSKRTFRHASKLQSARRRSAASARLRPYASNSGTIPTNAGFFAAPQIAAGGSATMPVEGDFNGDAKPDVAVMVYDSNGNPSIAVLLGNGDGTFHAPQFFPAFSVGADSSIENLYAADLNRDGKCDLLVVHNGSFDVLLSNGDGTFNGPVNYADLISNPSVVGFNDVNRDGIPDVMIADASSGMVSTLLGNGNGSFQAATQVTYPGSVIYGVFSDVNGDGRPDLISTSSVFLATSNGFQQPVSLVNDQGQISSCNWIQSNVAVADVNGDGAPDIITSDCENNTVAVFLNTGNGTFATGVTHFTGPYPAGVILADVNRDGHLDILAINDYENGVSVLLGAGDGSFQDATSGYSFGSLFWYAPVVADFNGDGIPDLISAQYSPGFATSLSYLQGVGDGSFLAAPDQFWKQSNDSYYSAAYANGMATADFNKDGIPDFVTGNYGDVNLGITVFLGGVSGGIAPPVNYGAGGGLHFVAVGDFDGDGNEDIAASDYFSGNVNLFLGNGDGTFKSAQVFAAVSGNANAIVAGDFNHDGKLDLAVAGSSTMAILLNSGSGGFSAPMTYPLNSQGWEMVAVDLNGDGKLDLAITQSQSHYLSIFLGNGDGTFHAVPDIDTISYGPTGIAAADLNRDGKTDLAITAEDWTGTVGTAVLLGNGDGTFQSPVLYASADQSRSWPTELQAVDINKDGKVDLIYADAGLGEIGIMFGQGDGTFDSAVLFPSNADPYGLVLADVNGDGALDAIAGCESFPGVTLSLNTSGSRATLISSVNPAQVGESVTFTASLSASVAGVKAVPTGTVTFLDGNKSLGSAVLNASQAALTVTGLAIGTHSITVSYSGDSTFVASVSKAVSQVVTQATSQTAIGSSLNPANLGQAVTLTASVTPALSAITLVPSGTVTFRDGSTSLGTVTLSNGSASLAVSNFAVGNHSITAAYSGDSSFQASTSAAMVQVIAKYASQVALSSSANPANAGQSITFTATASSSGVKTPTAPTGTVTFKDATTTLGTSSLTSGKATLNLSTLAAGTHSITAIYSGDSNFQGSTSAVLTQTVNKQGTETADFQFTSGASSLSVGIGQSGSLTLTVKPLNDFTGNVSLACGTQPAGITCQTSPNSVSITNSQSKTSTLTINVASSFVASNDARPRRDFPAAPWALGTLVLGFMGISGVRARKSAAFRAVVLIVVISGVLALAGCGAVQQQTPTSVTKTIQVTATGTSGNGSPIVHSINFNVTIQ